MAALTTVEAARAMGKSRVWVWRLIQDKRLRAEFNPQFRQWLIEEEDLVRIAPSARKAVKGERAQP